MILIVGIFINKKYCKMCICLKERRSYQSKWAMKPSFRDWPGPDGPNASYVYPFTHTRSPSLFVSAGTFNLCVSHRWCPRHWLRPQKRPVTVIDLGCSIFSSAERERDHVSADSHELRGHSCGFAHRQVPFNL